MAMAMAMAMAGEEVRRNEEEEEEVKWAGHYSSAHEILIVGDGDFSFSHSLATTFGSASNIVATSLDSFDTLGKKYARSHLNIQSLARMGANLIHELDATKMKMHSDLSKRKFDRIIFNFPHAGFKGREDNRKLINMHKKVVGGFLNNATHMLRPDGEIHISHKTTAPFSDWNLEELATKSSLVLIEEVDFEINDYPGYANKRGDGDRSDHPFPLGECSTFKFAIEGTAMKKNAKRKPPRPAKKMPFKFAVPQVDLFSTPRKNQLFPCGMAEERCWPNGLFGVNFAPPELASHVPRMVGNGPAGFFNHPPPVCSSPMSPAGFFNHPPPVCSSPMSPAGFFNPPPVCTSSMNPVNFSMYGSAEPPTYFGQACHDPRMEAENGRRVILERQFQEAHRMGHFMEWRRSVCLTPPGMRDSVPSRDPFLIY